MENSERWVLAVLRAYHMQVRTLARRLATLSAAECPDPEDVAWHLNGLLDQCARETERRDSIRGRKIFAELRYIMVAMADEEILATDWPGREVWRQLPLEQRLYGQVRSGDYLFEQIQQRLLRDEKLTRPTTLALAVALGLGFQGNLHRPEDAATLRRLRFRLFTQVLRRAPDSTLRHQQITPEAMRRPRSVPRGQTLFWGGLATLALALALWIGGGAVLWPRLTAPLVPEVDTLAKQLAPGDE